MTVQVVKPQQKSSSDEDDQYINASSMLSPHLYVGPMELGIARLTTGHCRALGPCQQPLLSARTATIIFLTIRGWQWKNRPSYQSIITMLPS